MQVKTFPVIVVFLALVGSFNCDAEHVVFLQTTSSYSHRTPQWPLVEALLARGHNVTYISPFAGGGKVNHPNVTDVVTSLNHEFMQWTLSHFDIYHRIYGIAPPPLLVYEPVSYISCLKTHQSPEFLEWLNHTTEIHLIFSDVGPECSYGLATKFNAKVAVFSTLPPSSKSTETFGISPETNIYPEWTYELKPPLTFLKRVFNAIMPLYSRASNLLWYNFMYPSIFKHMGLRAEELPDIYGMEANTSLVLLNGDFIEDYPRSLPGFIVKIPAMHIKYDENVTLSKELETFLNARDCLGGECDGAIYISFGTVCTAPSLPEYFREYFFKSIEEFPKLKFIWRWKGDLPKSYPKNLLLIPWVEQQKLLSHPKIKGFITQAGRPSMQEAFYHGVPTIAFPILADQDFNSNRYEILGTSIQLNIATITQAELTNAISSIISKKYQEKAKSLAELGRDVQVNPVEKALWWTEFALRHTQEELNLMKPLAQHQYWFQRRELDTWTFIFIVLSGMSVAWFYILKRLFKSMSRTRTMTNVGKKKD